MLMAMYYGVSRNLLLLLDIMVRGIWNGQVFGQNYQYLSNGIMQNVQDLIKKTRINRLPFYKYIPWKPKLTETYIEFFLACLVGLGAGYASVLFRFVLHNFHHFFLGILYPQLKEISELELAYHQLEQIKRQVNALSDFIASKLRDKHTAKPKTSGMIDPRTDKPFRQNSKKVG